MRDAPDGPSRSEDVQESERRLVSVVFADLTGFTAASGERDPEEVHALLSPVMQRLETIVESFGGRVVKTMGDGLMAVFGVPAATPEDAERAVRAAVAMRDEVRASAGAASLVSDLQAGVHTGWVFVVPARGGFDVIGDTVNVASRLVGLAPAGAVLVGASTAARTSSVIGYREREPAFVKGKPEPVVHFEVADDATRGGSGLANATGPFVGREAERVVLAEEWNAARTSRRSRIVSILGPPGIGKTRLIAEFARELSGARVLVGRAAPHAERIPWFALADALRGVDAAAGALHLIQTRPPPSPLHRDDRREMNSEIGAAVRSALTATAEREPVVLVIDDVQWADAQLVAMLADLDAHPWDAPLLVVCLGRADTPSHRPPAAAGREVRLDNLDRAASQDLIRRLLPGASIRADVEDELAGRAGGNPLFVEEIVRLFRETGVLRRESGCWRIVEGLRHELPESVQLVVAARIDALPAVRRRLLRDAAVCGETFRLGDLRALGWDDPRGDIDDLIARELLVEAGSGYAFRHAVIRDVAYGALPRAERARRHLELAAAIQKACGPDAAPVETLAHHYAQAALASASSGTAADASVVSAALEYLVRAGDSARSLRAFREAEAWYRQATEIHEPSADTAATPAGRAAVRASLRHSAALIDLHRYEEATTEASRALEIARAAGAREWEAEAVLQLGWLESEYGNLERARRLLERAGEHFTAIGDTLGRARVAWASARTMRLTDVDGMLAQFEEAAGLFASGGDAVGEHLLYEQLAYGCSSRGGEQFDRWFRRCVSSPTLGDEPRARAALLRTDGFQRFYRGAWIEAVEPLSDALGLARESGDFFVECDAAYLLARIAVARGRLDESEALARALAAAADDAAGHRQAEQAHVVLARVAARRGDPVASTRHLESAESLLAVAGNEREQQEVILARADIALDAGRWDEAASEAARYRERAERFGDRLEIPVPLLIAARALLGGDRLDDAALALSEALAAAERVGHGRVGVLAASLAAETAALRGRIEEAESLLAGARAFADPSRMMPDEAAAEAEAAAAVAAARGRPASDLRAEAVRGWRSLGVNVWYERAASIDSRTARTP